MGLRYHAPISSHHKTAARHIARNPTHRNAGQAKKLGSLSAYIETRGLSLSSKGPIFVLAPIKISKMKIKDSLSDVLGTHGFGRQPPADIAEQRRWKFKNGKYHTNELVLYIIRR